jgi:outer membrane protein insertion porin family
VKSVLKTLLTLAVVTTFTAAQTLQTIRLLGVEVEGNNETSTNVVKYTSGLVEGKEIKPGDFGNAITKLWETGIFADIQIHLDRETTDGIYIIIEVEENPILGEVIYEGGKKKKKDIEEELDLRSGQRIPPHLVKESTEKIKNLFAEDGYLRAEVEAELTEGSLPNVRDITFKIRENKKVKIRDIQFNGRSAFKDSKLRRQLKDTKIQKWFLFWRSNFDEDKFKEDKNLLASFYRNNGYKDFRILSESIDFTEDGKGMIIRFLLYEGPQYYLRNFSWEGNDLYSEDQLATVLDLEKGVLYDDEEFTSAVFEDVHGLYMDKGYIYSTIEPQFTPVGKDSLDVHFNITENHQVYVRNIDIAGNTKTRENVIRREMKIMPGDIFNRELLMRSAREIWILNYFADVRPDVVPVDDDKIDLLVTVEEKSSDQANASIGFTAEYGIMGGAGVQFNNFMGKGQQLAFNFNQGTQYSFYSYTTPSQYRSLSLSFTDPMINDTPVLVGFSAFYYLRGQNSYYSGIPLDREVFGGSVRLGRRLKWPDNYFRVSWMVQGTNKRYRGSQTDLEDFLGGIAETVGLSVTQSVSRDSRDHPEFPSRGSIFSWSSTLSGGPLSTSLLPVHENFHKHIFKFDWFTPVVWKFVLMSSWQMGAIKNLVADESDISVVPWDDLFIMGGSGIPYGTMLRGYLDNTVGPYNLSRQYPRGGRVMMKYVSELRVSLSENPTVYGLIFGEMGNAWKDFSDTDPFDMKRSAGFGIRMFMPMLGMLGFDLGYGFDDVKATSKSPEGWRFHILFGMPF